MEKKGKDSIQQEETKRDHENSNYSLVTTSSEELDSDSEEKITKPVEKANHSSPDPGSKRLQFHGGNIKSPRPKFYDEEITFNDPTPKHYCESHEEEKRINQLTNSNLSKVTTKISYRKPTLKDMKMRLAIFLKDHVSQDQEDHEQH
ncbi:unnamed protein product [Moneuplotes crassus]|uniref:Uncharacterized protein n=1 Tax=Euplotes crassus TaxID=5936 RepID=A0AAD1Y325_EUPCR|nr:unnamed protein product [Moneuplotes crassus]